MNQRISTFLLNLISEYGKELETDNVYDALMKRGISETAVEGFIEKVVKVNELKRNFLVQPLLLLIKESSKRKDHVKSFWKSWFSEITSMIDLVNMLYETIVLLIHFDEEPTEKSQTESINEEESLKKSFIALIKTKKQISKNEIMDYRRKGKLNFPNAGLLLNQLCLYNQKDEQF